MPLDPSLRSALGAVPALNRETTPATLRNHQRPSLGDLTYAEFEFDTATDKLGAGGNAVVYRATVPPDDTTVALKRPFPDKTVSPQTIERLLDEGEKWAAVDDHPYVASVFDWGVDGPPWIAIEYLSGGTLQDRLNDELDLSQRLWLSYALVDAVGYATGQHGLAHHDLHPRNVLFEQTPGESWDIPKIVDWGLSRELIQHTGSVSQATPEYAAPEQFDALMPDVPVGPHTDVYQLGVVCYELLTGTHPNHLREDVRPPSRVDSTVPSEVGTVVLQALAHERDNRITHPILFRERLENALEEIVDTGSGTESQDRSTTTSQSDPDRGDTGSEASTDVGDTPSGSASAPHRASDSEHLSDETEVEHLVEQHGGRIKQGTIVEETGWSSAKVSKLLDTLEEQDRIKKLRIGRESLITLRESDH